MNLILTTHAKKRMIERNIKIREIQESIDIPDYTISKNGKIEAYKKINEYEIEVTKELPAPEPIVVKYERSFIESQIETIIKDRDDYVAKRNTEILECQNIINEMDKMNIITKIEEFPIN